MRKKTKTLDFDDTTVICYVCIISQFLSCWITLFYQLTSFNTPLPTNNTIHFFWHLQKYTNHFLKTTPRNKIIKMHRNTPSYNQQDHPKDQLLSLSFNHMLFSKPDQKSHHSTPPVPTSSDPPHSSRVETPRISSTNAAFAYNATMSPLVPYIPSRPTCPQCVYLEYWRWIGRGSVCRCGRWRWAGRDRKLSGRGVFL